MKLYGGPKDATLFLKLVELMIAPTSEVDGCECIFPDSVFFGEDGKPMFVAKSDRNDKMTSQTHRLGLQDVRQRLA